MHSSLAALFGSLAIVSAAHAAPQGGQIVGGSGSISQSNLTTNIKQNTQNLAIDWQSYNLDANEVINYLQPNSSSVALNRILGGSASQIFGQINANGHVVLVNPNGVFFGETATVNVGGLIASGLDIGANDFMNGNYLFNEIEGSAGLVINSGLINASLGGNVGLIGKQVANDGVISAQLGSVVMAAGKEAVLTFDSNGLIGVQVTREVLQEDIGVDPAVLNSGNINAAGGRVLLSGSVSRDVFSNVVNHNGIEQATSVVLHEDGSFTLGGGADVENSGSIDVSGVQDHNAGMAVVLGENIANSGNIQANSEQGQAGFIELHANDTTQLTNHAQISAQTTQRGSGGQIQVLGNKVGLFDAAEVTADGVNGGGEVLIGGDQQGRNGSIRNADFIYLGEATQVSANASDSGNGGTVITYADDTARIYGGLSATGGKKGGDGGFIETSGKLGFEILSAPEVGAVQGAGGSWLIDPNNISIVGGSGNTNIGSTSPFDTTDDGAGLGVDLIVRALSQVGGPVTVTITTGDADSDGSSAGTGTEPGSITLNTNLDFDGIGTDDTLTLQAEGDIIIGSGYLIGEQLDQEDPTLNDSLSLNLFAGGSVTINSGADVSTNGGDFTVDGWNNGTTDLAVDSYTNSGTINTSSGAKGGNITITTSGNATLGSMDLRDTSIDVKNVGVTKSDGTPMEGGGKILVNAGGDITVSEVYDFNDTFGNLVGEGNTSITLKAGNNINIDASIYDGSGEFWDTQDISLTANGMVNIDADIYLGGGNLIVDGNGFDSSGVTINTDYSHSGQDNPSTNGGNVTLDMTGSVTVGNIITEQQSICGAEVCGNVKIRTTDAVSIASGAQIITYGGSFTVGYLDTNAPPETKIPTSFTMGTGSLINTTGNTNTKGGAITINTQVDANDSTKGGSINITSLVANGGEAVRSVTDELTAGAPGLDGGAIALSAGGDIDISGNLSSNGSTGDYIHDITGHFGKAGGKGGGITLESTSGNIGVKGILSSEGGKGSGDDNHGNGADPANGGSGGTIQVTATVGSVSVGEVSTQGGEAVGDAVSVDNTPDKGDVAAGEYARSGDGGAITLDAANGITLNGNLNSKAGALPREGHAGTGGAITVEGDAIVAASTRLDTNIGIGSTINNVNSDGADGSVTFTGTLSGQTARAQSLTITTGSIDFQGNVGANSALGALTLNATGDIKAETNGDNAVKNSITATSLNVTASNSFTSAAINTTGADNTTEAEGSNGGLVSITADTKIEVASINASGGKAATDDFAGDSAGFSGGNITLAAQDITTGNLITQGSAASGSADNNGGNGGNISLTATDNDGTPSITLNGDINTQGGAAAGAGSAGGIGTKSISVNGSGTAKGSINIGYTGTFTDTFTVTGNTSDDTLTGPILTGANEWEITNAGYGTLNTRVTFTGFEKLAGNTGDDKFEFSGNGAIDSIDGGGGEGRNSITGRDESNTFTLTTANTAVTGKVAVGDDTYLGLFSNIQTLNGSSEGTVTDTLIGHNNDNTWQIDSAGGGTIVDTSDENSDENSDAPPLITFTGMENLTGGSRADTFNLTSNGSLSGLLDGGKGPDTPDNTPDAVVDKVTVANNNVDTVAINSTDTNVNLRITNIEDVSGNGTGDAELIGDNNANTWNVSGSKSGDINKKIKFSAFSKLTGGEGNDHFDFSSGGSIVSVNGGDGSGSDSLTGHNASNSFTLTAANEGTVAETGGNTYVSFSKIQTLNGVDGNYTDTLIGHNNDNTWRIDSAGGGTIVDTSDNNTTALITFTQMEVLSGNTANDSFEFTSGDNSKGSIGTINGGGGNNSLTGHDANNTFTLSSANTGGVADDTSTYVTSFSSIQTLNGSSGEAYTDTLIGHNNDNTWRIGSAGGGTIVDTSDTTTLITFTQMENLTGGSGADTFNLTTGSLSGLLDGGTGPDTPENTPDTVLDKVTITNTEVNTVKIKNTAVNTVPIDSADTVYDLTITNIEKVTGNGGDSSKLIAANQVNEWNLKGSDSLNGMEFDNFKLLVGGDAEDRFIGGSSDFAIFTSINGGDGIDFVDVSEGVVDGVLSIADFSLNSKFGDTVEGILGSDELVLKGDNYATTWQITGANTGTLSYTDSGGDDHSWWFKFGNLTGGSGADTFNLDTDGSLSGLLNGGAGAGMPDTVKDSVTISESNTTVNTVAINSTDTGYDLTITNIEEVSGNGSDSAELIGDNAANTWTLTGLNAGELNNRKITFSGFTNLTGGSGIDTFSLTIGSLDGLLDGGSAPDTPDTVADRVTISNEYVNTVAISATDTTHDLTITNIEDVSGNGTGDAKLIGDNNDTTWTLTALNVGNLNNGAMSFSGFTNLTGGSGADTFNLTTGSLSGLLDGGSGSDSVAITNTAVNSVAISATDTDSHLTITNIEGVSSHGGANTKLIGDNNANTWTLTALNAGHLNNEAITFSGFTNLTGGSGADTFSLTTGSLDGLLDGGSGPNTPDTVVDRVAISATNTAVNTVAINSTDTNNDLRIANIENVSGNGTTNAELIGDNNANTWTLTGANAGHLNSGAITFSGFTNLTGGSGADTFNLTSGSLSGLLDGGTGMGTSGPVVDKVTITNTNVDTVAISSIDTIGNDLTITNIEDVSGNGTGDAKLIGDNNANTWHVSGSKSGDINNEIRFSAFSKLTGGTGTDHFDFSSGGSIVEVNGGGGSNSLTGRNANNRYTLTDANAGKVEWRNGDTYETYIDTFSAIQTLNGSSSTSTSTSYTDTLVGNDNANTWTITSAGGGTVSDTSGKGLLITFTAMENLTGGAANDEFIVQTGGSLSGLIDGGDESSMDSLHYAIVNNVKNTWIIDSVNSGSINNHEIDFTEIESVRGSEGADTFKISNTNFIRNINGGSDKNDIVDFSGLSGNISVTMGTNTGFVDIEEFMGNSSDPSRATLVGANTTNTWVITGQDQGTINGFAFSNFANLTGGTMADTFIIDTGTSTNITRQMELNGGENTDNTVFDSLIGPNYSTKWEIDGSNTLTSLVAGTTLNIAFSEFENLTAKGGDDSFAFVGTNNIAGTVNAGEGIDNIDLSQNKGEVKFNLAGGFNGRLNFEKVTGNGANSTLIGANAVNNWTISGENDGSIDNLKFDDFANLTGGSNSDTFKFESAGVIEGLINGGGNSDSATDFVDLTGKAEAITVQWSASGQSGNKMLEVTNIDRIDANSAFKNTLRSNNASANSWSLDGAGSGVLNGTLRFNNFAKLFGQDGLADTFTLASGATGFTINGGDGTGTDKIINSHALATTWYIGNSTTHQGSVSTTRGSANLSLDFNGIENLEGSDDAVDTFHVYAGTSLNSIDGGQGAFNDVLQSHLTTATDWSISGTNSGGIDRILASFSDIESLIGSAADDSFNMSAGGSITGMIDGGNETKEDVVNYSEINGAVEVNLSSVSFQDIEFVKGNGSQSTMIGADTENTWTLTDNGAGSINKLVFVDFTDLTGGDLIDTFNVSNTGSLAGQINAGAGDDVMNVTLAPLASGSVRFNGESGSDTVTITGGSANPVSVTYTLAGGVEQLAYTDSSDTYSVAFTGTEAVNDNFTAQNLKILGSSGNDLIELGGQGFSVNGGANIETSGKTSLQVDALGGNDRITISATPTLLKNASVILSAENLATVNNSVLTSKSLTLSSVGTVGSATGYFLTDIDSLSLDGVADDLYLSNFSDLSLDQFDNISGDIDLISRTGDISNSADLDQNVSVQMTALAGDIQLSNVVGIESLSLDAQNVTIDNGSNALSVQHLAASGSAVLNSEGMSLNGDISVGADSQFNAGSGTLDQQGSLLANGNATLTLSAGSVNQSGTIKTGSGQLSVVSTGAITMNPSAASSSSSGNISYQAQGDTQGDITVTELTAEQGKVALITRNGEIIDRNLGSTNVIAHSLEIDTQNGVGNNDAFETQVAQMDIVNDTSGVIDLVQDGEVELIALQNTGGLGNIRLLGNDDVHFNPGSVIASQSGSGGDLIMKITQGDFLGVGAPDSSKPDITAKSAVFLANNGTFGSFKRFIVMNVRDSLAIYASRLYKPYFVPKAPDHYDPQGLEVSIFGTLSAIAGEQMVEVETLSDVDPAIFTELRNYSFEDVSVRLPRDQLYEDELEEDEVVGF